MNISTKEMENLHEMQENVRHSILALELCACCECVSECEPALVDEGCAVWLCQRCLVKLQDERARGARLLLL